MEVAFVNRMLCHHRGGGEIWDLRMAENLRDMGVDVTFVVAAPFRGECPNPVEGIPSVYVRTPYLLDLAYTLPPGPAGVLADADIFAFARRAASEINDVDPDILHINTWPHFASIADSFDGPSVIKMNGPPHSLWFDLINPFTSSYKMLDRYDAVVTTGITTEAVAERTSHEPVEINPGVDTETFSPSSPENEATNKHRDDRDVLEILFVGRFVRTKNLSLLVDAVTSLPSRIDAHLTLVGDGPRRAAVRRHVEGAALDDVVTFEGYVSNQALPDYYRNNDVFTLSSRRENYPIVLLEAMSCGTPVVAPDTGAIDSIVTHREDGLLYESGSVEGLRDHLVQLHDNPKFRDKLGNQARLRALQSFDWGDRAERLEELYTTLNGGR